MLGCLGKPAKRPLALAASINSQIFSHVLYVFSLIVRWLYYFIQDAIMAKNCRASFIPLSDIQHVTIVFLWYLKIALLTVVHFRNHFDLNTFNITLENIRTAWIRRQRLAKLLFWSERLSSLLFNYISSSCLFKDFSPDLTGTLSQTCLFLLCSYW